MKTTLIYLMTIVMSLNVAHAQQNNYETAMQKAFELWGQDKPFEAANMFERIAKAENENWLPHYYVAHINIVYSFGERDKEKLSLQLEKAKQQLEKAKQISPDNPEIMVLEALHNTAWIAYDGATYGMTLSAPTSQIYKKASEIAPDNPRVVYCKAEWEMGSAKYFGEDTSPFCKDFEKALTLFDTFKNDTPFYPSWGKDRAEILLAECNKTE
ncbi:hypothetical protein OOZ15_17850 [Galbibacter sp. EGI 63066]|uniref:hypothetical protein n=1 Tax=Galbibacter sp. EGI 63066 TaxID=2993559 RepID=UPI002248C712|nr:hypothetical protein [Galbibacter sp. EGI 63066]MCX2681823.1 hypothetical protein [Galbibacter sp. EGI 63066]